ncbi:MAG: hypothetical protein HC904_08740 [Blastochloris sp.]|nr:hypothetical protein [Blastochloris sp.]
MTTEKISSAWVIDNTAPELSRTRLTREWVEIEVRDATSLLDKVEFSSDGLNFRLIPPMDGILDSSQEKFRVPRMEGKVLYFRATDRSGNVGGLRVKED